MKILIIRPWPTLLDVTQNTYNVQEVGLAKALCRRGHPTDILFWTDQREKTVEIFVENGFTIHVFYRKGAAFLKNGWFYRFKDLAPGYDIFQTSEYNQFFSWHLAGAYPDKTVIYHGPYDSPFNKNYNRMCRIFDAFFVDRYRQLGTPFLAKSRLAQKFLLDRGISPQNVAAVGVGIDLERLSGQNDDRTELEIKMRTQASGMKLLYIGRIEPRRDPFFLLNVLREVRAAGQKAFLYIVGDGNADYVEQVRAAILNQGLGSFVFWQKKVPQSQMKGIYEQADFFLLPSEFEIFGMVLLEAMFFHRIVVTTPNGGSDMLLRTGENGLFLEKSSPALWAQAICTLYQDPVRRETMQDAAYETVVHKSTWDILADRFLFVYKNAVKRSEIGKRV